MVLRSKCGIFGTFTVFPWIAELICRLIDCFWVEKNLQVFTKPIAALKSYGQRFGYQSNRQRFARLEIEIKGTVLVCTLWSKYRISRICWNALVHCRFTIGSRKRKHNAVSIHGKPPLRWWCERWKRRWLSTIWMLYRLNISIFSWTPTLKVGFVADRNLWVFLCFSFGFYMRSAVRIRRKVYREYRDA